MTSRTTMMSFLENDENSSTVEISFFEIDGTGNLIITATGGSSASEGGMGNSNDEDKAKGDLSSPNSDKSDSDMDDTSFDPIKKNVREVEKEGKKDE